MDYVIDWLGFLGAWLLVAGPLNQASIELSEEQVVSQEEIASLTGDIEPEPPVSPWWWLIPPVGYWKNHQRTRRRQQRTLDALSPDQIRTLISFLMKGTAWFMVATGAALIAAKETWEVTERMEWPWGVFFVLYTVAALLAAGYTVERARRNKTVVAEAERRHPTTGSSADSVSS